MVLFAQFFVAALVLAAAGLSGWRFRHSPLTDFELARRVKAGDEAAKREAELRTQWPLLDALRRLILLIVTIVIVVILAGVYTFFVAIIWALAWLFVIEFLSTQQWLQAKVRELTVTYESQLLQASRTLRPLLRLLADSNALDREQRTTFYSKDELLMAVENSTQVLDKEEKLLIRQSLSYRSMMVKDIMTPRSVVVTVAADDTVGPILLDKLHKSGHSRFPVIEEDFDHVQGVLYMHNLVPLNPKHKKVADAMSRKVYYVQQDKSLDHVLQAFLRTKHHLFMVANEFEEIVGVVSIEDVLETIIGRKIIDEFDQYEDLRAVARLAAAERKKQRQT